MASVGLQKILALYRYICYVIYSAAKSTKIDSVKPLRLVTVTTSKVTFVTNSARYLVLSHSECSPTLHNLKNLIINIKIKEWPKISPEWLVHASDASYRREIGNQLCTVVHANSRKWVVEGVCNPWRGSVSETISTENLESWVHSAQTDMSAMRYHLRNKCPR